MLNKSTQTGCVEVKKKSKSTQTDVPDLSDEVEDMFNEDPSVMQISESEESEDADESTIIIQSTINQSTYIQEEENLERRRQALLRRK